MNWIVSYAQFNGMNLFIGRFVIVESGGDSELIFFQVGVNVD